MTSSKLPVCEMEGWRCYGCRPSNSDRKCPHYKPGRIYCPNVKFTPEVIEEHLSDNGPECCKCPNCTDLYAAAERERKKLREWLDKKSWFGFHWITNRKIRQILENRKFFKGWTAEERETYIRDMAEWTRKNEEARSSEWKKRGGKK